MKLSNVGMFAALVILATPIRSATRDRFDELFEAKAPCKDIIVAMISYPPHINYQQLQEIQQHIKDEDEYASYARTLLKDGQKALDIMLSKAGYNSSTNIDLEDFLEAANNIWLGKTAPQQMYEPFLKLDDYVYHFAQGMFKEANRKVVEKLLHNIDNIDLKIGESPARALCTKSKIISSPIQNGRGARKTTTKITRKSSLKN